MTLKVNRLSILYLSILIFLFIGCKHKSSHFVEYNNYNHKWINTEFSYSSSNDVEFELYFLNNPFKFDTLNWISFGINDETIYNGRFHESIKIRIPMKYTNIGVRTDLRIETDKKVFIGCKKGNNLQIKIDSIPFFNKLNVIFLPEYDPPDDYIIFSGWAE